MCVCRCVFVCLCSCMACCGGDQCSEEELFYSSEAIRRKFGRAHRQIVDSVCVCWQTRRYTVFLQGLGLHIFFFLHFTSSLFCFHLSLLIIPVLFFVFAVPWLLVLQCHPPRGNEKWDFLTFKKSFIERGNVIFLGSPMEEYFPCACGKKKVTLSAHTHSNRGCLFHCQYVIILILYCCFVFNSDSTAKNRKKTLHTHIVTDWCCAFKDHMKCWTSNSNSLFYFLNFLSLEGDSFGFW